MADVEALVVQPGRLFTDLFTTKNGDAWDVGRVLWALGVIAFIGLAGWAVIVNKEHFDGLAYGGGLAAALAAGGWALGAKAKTEPGG